MVSAPMFSEPYVRTVRVKSEMVQSTTMSFYYFGTIRMMKLRVLEPLVGGKWMLQLDTDALQQSSTEHPHFACRWDVSLVERERLDFSFNLSPCYRRKFTLLDTYSSSYATLPKWSPPWLMFFSLLASVHHVLSAPFASCFAPLVEAYVWPIPCKVYKAMPFQERISQDISQYEYSGSSAIW